MIKELKDSQIKRIMDIWLETNITAHSFIDKDYWVKNYDVVKNQYIPISQTFIYEEDEQIKGFISVIDSSFIGALFVSEEYQRQGIGKKLIDYCKSLYSSLELCAYVENIAAVNFYEHCGFRVLGKQINDDSGFVECRMKWTK
ncbi:acetyltransferase [Clostridium acetobutylicum]|nr:acetyltransferase [Clostridium acetobutylicum]